MTAKNLSTFLYFEFNRVVESKERVNKVAVYLIILFGTRKYKTNLVRTKRIKQTNKRIYFTYSDIEHG